VLTYAQRHSSSWKKRVEKGIPQRYHRDHHQRNDRREDTYQRRQRHKNIGHGVGWFLAFSGVSRRRCGSRSHGGKSRHSAGHLDDAATVGEEDEDEDDEYGVMTICGSGGGYKKLTLRFVALTLSDEL
jgi:hypothetical protein